MWQESVFNLYAALMYVVAGGWLLGETTGAVDVHPEYPATLRFVCACFCLVLGVIYLIDWAFMLKATGPRGRVEDELDY